METSFVIGECYRVWRDSLRHGARVRCIELCEPWPDSQADFAICEVVERIPDDSFPSDLVLVLRERSQFRSGGGVAMLRRKSCDQADTYDLDRAAINEDGNLATWDPFGQLQD